MRLKRFLYFAIIIIFALMSPLTISACSKTGETGQQTAVADRDTKSSESETSKSQQSATSTTVKETTTTSRSLPENLQKFIDDADKLFKAGEYAEAVSAYRTAKTNLQAASSVDPEIISKAIEKMEVNFDKAKTITDTARIHYGNAMQLEYEKRIDEAIEQLEEALKIYPRYQDAIDALASIKTLYKLK